MSIKVFILLGLFIIFQTLLKSAGLKMFEIFILFMGTAITLTVGKIIWDCSQNREDDKNEC